MTTRHMIFRAVGDTGPDLHTTLEGVTISTLGGITVRVRRPDDSLLQKSIVIDDDAGGKFHIVWDAGDLIEGDHKVEYSIVDGGGYVDRTPEKAPLIIRVRPEV